MLLSVSKLRGTPCGTILVRTPDAGQFAGQISPCPRPHIVTGAPSTDDGWIWVRFWIGITTTIPPMDTDLTNTARDYYLVRIAGGAVPEVWEGGLLDGLEFFPLTLVPPRKGENDY